MLSTIVNDVLRTSQVYEVSSDTRIKSLTCGNVVVSYTENILTFDVRVDQYFYCNRLSQ